MSKSLSDTVGGYYPWLKSAWLLNVLLGVGLGLVSLFILSDSARASKSVFASYMMMGAMASLFFIVLFSRLMVSEDNNKKVSKKLIVFIINSEDLCNDHRAAVISLSIEKKRLLFSDLHRIDQDFRDSLKAGKSNT